MNSTTLQILTDNFTELNRTITQASNPNFIDKAELIVSFFALIISAITIILLILNFRDTKKLIKNEIESRKDAFFKPPRIEMYNAFQTDSEPPIINIKFHIIFDSKNDDNSQVRNITFNGIKLPEIDNSPNDSTGYRIEGLITDHNSSPYGRPISLCNLNASDVKSRKNILEISFYDIFGREHKFIYSFHARDVVNSMNEIEIYNVTKKIELAKL